MTWFAGLGFGLRLRGDAELRQERRAALVAGLLDVRGRDALLLELHLSAARVEAAKHPH